MAQKVNKKGTSSVKRSGVLHGELSKIIAELGHGQSLVVADYGLPVPVGVQFIDLAVSQGYLSFANVLKAILSELPVESAVVAGELPLRNPDMFAVLSPLLQVPIKQVPHDEFKSMLQCTRAIVRTGEWSPFANVMLVAGVVF